MGGSCFYYQNSCSVTFIYYPEIQLIMLLGIKKTLVILLHGIIGWVGCGLVMIGLLNLTTIYMALIIHFIAAPFIFLAISNNYFHKFDYTSPLITAILLTLIVIALDFFVVAITIEKNLEMFENPMGTWLPFLFIFLTVWLRGLAIHRGGE